MQILPDKCDLWRMGQVAGQPSGKLAEQAIHTGIACLIIPISSFDAALPYAREATHIAFLPWWLGDLQAEDEIHMGRRSTVKAQVVPFRYVVNGIRRYGSFGLRHLEAFVKERE